FSLTVTTTTMATPDTTPPSSPTNLTATAASATQINLSLTAYTDNVCVTGYRVERCQGAACSNFAQIAAPTTLAFNDTGLTASTSSSYLLRPSLHDALPISFSLTVTTTTMATPDTTPPSSPTNLTATAASATQINLSWTVSTDKIGVTGYRVERCQGAACFAFAEIAAPLRSALHDPGQHVPT